MSTGRHYLADPSPLHDPRSAAVHPAWHRRLDTALPRVHPHYHPVAPASSLSGADPLSTHARPLRFFYACLHFTTYLVFDKLFDALEIWKDVYKRPFIAVGFLAFTLLIPLAITSTAGWIRRLGGRRWRILHRAVYISAVCGVIHYYWLVKSAVIRPLLYAGLVGLLLSWRVGEWLLRRQGSSHSRSEIQVVTADKT
jgi:sulfoxide reductase heme-binding subunit YedZ